MKLFLLFLLVPGLLFSQLEIDSVKSDMFGVEYFAKGESHDNLIMLEIRQYDDVNVLEFSECLDIDSNDMIAIMLVNGDSTSVYKVLPHLNDHNELVISLKSYSSLEQQFLNTKELILVINKLKYGFDISNIKSIYKIIS